ncbi:transposase [uncultured Draconibacterium sp.]|uniref:transposase n=1 Tax=uncultured Draconibacterium sp. TaxID=1573823 RepID=UPI0029C85F02|nr:transposase [uncultured Draconibacterium sp.]
MPDKFRNKYRISSARLQNWDYGRHAAYFVTICTQGREHYFGHVVDGEMHLSAIGEIAQTEWLKTFDLRPDMNLTMGEYIIMPNHFHAIIIIGENRYNTDGGNENGDGGGDGHVETQCIASLLPQTPEQTQYIASLPPANQFGPQRKNLASIIRGFKIGVTTRARKINPGFAWQSRYHEHIIRNNASFERICNYIISNPENWDADRNKTD